MRKEPKAGMRIRIINSAGAGWLPEGCVRTIKAVDLTRDYFSITTYEDVEPWAANDKDFKILGIEPYYKALCGIK
jgi:hypothetical protein